MVDPLRILRGIGRFGTNVVGGPHQADQPATQRRTAQRLAGADDDVLLVVILVVEESAVQAVPGIAEVGVADEPRRRVPVLCEVLGEGRKGAVEGAVAANVQLVRPAPVNRLACEGSVQGAADRASPKTTPRPASRVRLGVVSRP